MTPSTHADAPVFRFGPGAGFMTELKARVDEYFRTTGQRERGGWKVYLKALAVVAWLAASYVLLVFYAENAWQVVALAASLALAVAAVGFNVQHDGNHGAFSDRAWLNRLAGWGLDLVGGSSYVWRYQHNILHHTYTNLAGADDDISLGPLGRLSPAQPWRGFYRLQHIYIWPLYAFMALRWQLFADFVSVVRGRLGPQRFPRPKGWALAGFVLGKAFVFTVAFVIPMARHHWAVVLATYFGSMLLTGLVLAVVFQLAHTVESAEHPAETAVPGGGAVRVPLEWAVHQIETTVNFARGSRLVTWFVGGLNFQVEHHLFPRIAHIHYPALSRIVEDTCARFGVRYRAYTSMAEAVASHYRFLREMGRPPAALATV